MPHFNEHALEQGIMELFQEEGYTYSSGETIQKEASDVLLRDDLMLYLKSQYPDLSDLELKRVILKLTAHTGLSLYGENARIIRLISNGFSIEREDSSKPNIHIRPIDFECVSNNIFRIVNQLEVVGLERRIPDGVVYINGLPVVVLEFKSAVKEYAIGEIYRSCLGTTLLWSSAMGSIVSMVRSLLLMTTSTLGARYTPMRHLERGWSRSCR